MNPFAALAAKTVSSAGAAALLSLGLAGGLVQAASPSPKPPPSASTTGPATDRRAIGRAVFESEADVLGIAPQTLRKDLKNGQKVSGLAKDKGLTKEQFETKLIASVKPRLASLVDHRVITQAEAGHVIDRISKGHVPFWNGIHHRK